jgi:hypothetical protein
MKNYFLIFPAVFFLILTSSCDARTTAQQEENVQVQAERIDVYYFHFSRRCVTCKTVEAEAKNAVETLYPELYRDNEVTFQSINLDEETGRKLAKTHGVTGQSLLIVSGSEKADLIREGFMYARTDPEKFRQVIKQQIDGLL